MRKIYLVDADAVTEAHVAAAVAAGAAEVIAGIPPRLAALGVATFGYHEVEDAAPVVPQLIEMRKAKLEMLATPWPTEENPDQVLLDVVEARVATSRALQIEFAGQTLSRTRDLVVDLQAELGVPDAMMDALFVAADARP